VFVLSTNQKGGIAETAITAAATKLGIPVFLPVVEHSRADLVFEIGDRLFRVQCKWGALSEDHSIIKVALQTNYLTASGYVSTSYTADEIDLVAVYCAELDRSYLLPISTRGEPASDLPPADAAEEFSAGVSESCGRF
jgi:PD-(D/E)XK endonuclease